MSPLISRGFGGRRRRDVDPSRIPPGQYVVDDFPVLSAGPTPSVSLDDVDVLDHRRRRRTYFLVVGGVPRAAE